MSGLVWGLVSVYLIAAAVSLLGADFRTPRGEPPSALVVCFIALVFAAAWPLRALRSLLGRET